MKDRYDEATRTVAAMLDRHMVETAQLIDRYPQSRVEICYALLGSAIGYCDTFGVDVLEFVNRLRAEARMPAVLIPPKSKQS